MIKFVSEDKKKEIFESCYIGILLLKKPCFASDLLKFEHQFASIRRVQLELGLNLLKGLKILLQFQVQSPQSSLPRKKLNFGCGCLLLCILVLGVEHEARCFALRQAKETNLEKKLENKQILF